MNKQTILTKISALADSEFSYSFSSTTEPLREMDYGCSGIIMEATILHFEIKNIPSLLKTGKRLAARVYKMYHDILSEVAKETHGLFSCVSPENFLLIYPKENYEAACAVDNARKIAELITKSLNEVMEKHTPLNFAIGIDMGNIIGTKTKSDDDSDRIIWIGSAIDKAKAISHECNRPFYIGISGTVYHHLDEEHRTITKRIMGFKKQVEIWSTVSYMFENVKKHLYQTNHLIPFEDEQ